MIFIDFILDIILIVVPIIIWYYRGLGNDVFPSTETAPPEGILPSEISYIMTGKVENSDISTLIINWAERGYIKINCDDNFKLEKIMDIPYSSRSYEIYLFDKLFNKYGNGTELEWKKLSHVAKNRLRRTKRKIIKYFTTNNEQRIFSADGRPYMLLVSLIATLPVAKLIFIELFVLGNQFRFGPVLTIIINALILISLYFISSILAKPARLRSEHSWTFIFIIFILITGLAVGLTAFWIVGGGSGGFRYVLSMISSFIIIIVLNMMTQRTSEGDQVYEKCLGFMNYVKNTDRELITKDFEKNNDMFYQYFSYTASMGVSDKWAEHFVSKPFHIPGWCISSKKTCSNTVDFNNLMTDFMKILG
ncbi:MAG: DUF2207 domain-containing protein [Spirochaetales bacterium]|nr:DUF2207 domain-containing protein [Spirochaetales bacterium]